MTSQLLSRAACSQLLKRAMPLVSCRATLVGKEMRAGRPEYYTRPPPYDYINKRYDLLGGAFDGTKFRFNSNTKVIVVEGPIGAGKSQLARELADQFDMVYIPEPDVMSFHSNPNIRLDYRPINDAVREMMPWAAEMDVEEFYANPNTTRTTLMQYMMLFVRFDAYCDGLWHLLSTGQGVVFDRSPHSDVVFMDAIHNAGYCSEVAWTRYHMLRDDILQDLMAPHLVIYLDANIETIRKRIKKRGREAELKTEVLTDNYLRTMESTYKHLFIPEMKKNSEVLIYDWNEPSEVDEVVEDLENLDLDSYERLRRFEYWNLPDDASFCGRRRMFDREQRVYLHHQFTKIPTWDIPEMVCPDITVWRQAMALSDNMRSDIIVERPEVTSYWGMFSGHYPGHFRTIYTNSNMGAWNNCLERL